MTAFHIHEGSYDRATPEQRRGVVVESCPDRFHGPTWNVVSPAGHCFDHDGESGRHTQVEFSLKAARKVAETTAFAACPVHCECRREATCEVCS